jgi:hypothetical protein
MKLEDVIDRAREIARPYRVADGRRFDCGTSIRANRRAEPAHGGVGRDRPRRGEIDDSTRNRSEPAAD